MKYCIINTLSQAKQHDSDKAASDQVGAIHFATLSAFTDPYANTEANESNAFTPHITYEVKAWENGLSKPIIEDDRKAINRSVTEDMEHVLSGNIDEHGVFRGQVKAFGEWRLIGNDYVIYPPKDYTPPKGPTTYLGHIGFHVTTYERERNNSTHSDEEHLKFEGLAKQHSGFLIFRNGLRVLPYGRIDNDFFEIEKNRSVSAGREYWNARRMFGRIAISRELNPNLRDKAGREGFIDNQSAKALRIIVRNILKQVAYEYFGSNSELRKELLPDIRARNQKEKIEKQKKELTGKNAKKFKARLKKNLPAIIDLHESTDEFFKQFNIENEEDLNQAQIRLNDINNQLNELRIPSTPAKLGSNEDNYRQYRTIFSELQGRLKILSEARAEAIERIKPSKPEQIADKQLRSLASRLHSKLATWRKSIKALQQSEQKRVDRLFDERNKAFHALATPLVEQVKMEQLNLDSALTKMETIHEQLDTENEDTFQSYLDALEIMSENINIELIARQGTVDNISLRENLNQLNQLAQLGVTVEILGHELNSNERMIREGLRQVKKIGNIPGTQLIENGFDALNQQLEFLSPLKISGSRTRRLITGHEVTTYLKSFFQTALLSRNINIEASDDFIGFEIIEQPARILPVFVNLVNNSVYWLATSHTKKPRIELAIVDKKVVISDNGPGIDPLDQESLFKIFFTKKVSGGRGVGLYLCRINLLAGSHTIEYADKTQFQRLSGANFVIDFKGASFG